MIRECLLFPDIVLDTGDKKIDKTYSFTTRGSCSSGGNRYTHNYYRM